VLDTALAQCAAWAAAGLELQVAVNLSMRNLRDASIVALVERLLRQHGVPSRLLCLELTESTIMADVRGTRETLLRLADLGVRLAIDDFGTGYSSLSYLTTLPVHELKIDRSFVQQMKTQSQSQCIVALTIGLAHSLGLDVVTEGVEDAETWALLAQLGADQAQGYYMSRPVPAEAIIQPVIIWSTLYSGGIEKVDRQHQVLIGLINRLHEAMNHGRDQDVVEDVLNGLVDFVRTHFATEEQLMLRHAYPGYGEHKAAHDDFAQKVAATQAGFLRGEVVVTLPLAQFLRDWLIRHMLEMDKQMGAYLCAAVDRVELPTLA
jgi:hemerythrin-like metal-binding protein